MINIKNTNKIYLADYFAVQNCLTGRVRNNMLPLLGVLFSMSTFIILGLLVIGIVYLLIRVTKKKNSHLNDTPGGDIKCPNCGFIGAPVKYTRGSFWIEIILWLCFLVPGLIYSVWRLTTKSIVCPRCKYNNIIPFVKPDGTSHDEKICPYCAETIKAAAKICKHCSKEVT